LLDFNPDYIKIDGSLIKNVFNDTKKLKILRIIVDFARNLDSKIIAEFVEDQNIQSVMEMLSIDYSQGYHFSKPIDSL